MSNEFPPQQDQTQETAANPQTQAAETPNLSRGARLRAWMKSLNERFNTPENRERTLKLAKTMGHAALEGVNLIETNDKTGVTRINHENLQQVLDDPRGAARVGGEAAVHAGINHLADEAVTAARGKVSDFFSRNPGAAQPTQEGFPQQGPVPEAAGVPTPEAEASVHPQAA
jgi:hypothetical protein